MSLYAYEPSTEEYYAEPSPSPYVQYYYYTESTSSYAPYEPTAVSWTDYYYEPQTDLYYYEPSTEQYYVASEPSPFAEYYTWSEQTQSYQSYTPSPV